MLIIHPEKKNPKLLELLEREADKKIYPKNSILCTPDDLLTDIAYIATGRIRCYAINHQGIEKTLHIYNGGWFMREGIYSSDESFVATRFLQTEEETVLYNINQSSYTVLIKQDVFLNALLLSSSLKVEMLRQEIESMIFDSGKERLLKLLYSLANTSAIKDGNWASVNSTFTQQELAGIVGVNRVTISRFISELCKSGNIRIVNRKYQVRVK